MLTTRFLVLFLTLLSLANVSDRQRCKGNCIFSDTTLLVQAFLPSTPQKFTPRSAALLELNACRVNAKKEKRKRNRDNMRKFQTPGRRGLSRRKLLKKTLASRARAQEAEFIAKCFTVIPMEEEESASNKN